MNESGYIYILKSAPYYKVGKAFDLPARLKLYGKFETRPFKLYYYRHVLDNATVERKLLHFCRLNPRRGKEWFRLPRRKVFRLIKYLESLPGVDGKPNRKAYLESRKYSPSRRRTIFDESDVSRVDGIR